MSLPYPSSHHTQLYSDDDRAKYSRLAGRIHHLSTAVWRTHLQPPVIDAHCSKRNRSWMWAYSSIATLLARDADEAKSILVTGGPLKDGRFTTTTIVVREPPTNASPYVTASPADPMMRISRVNPSNVDLSFLASDRKGKNLAAHASDVLRALILVSGSRRGENTHEMHHMCCFILRRCWPEVAGRVDAVSSLLNFPDRCNIVTIMKAWDCRDDDFSPHYCDWETVRDPELSNVLIRQGLRPCKSYSNEDVFMFCPRTLRLWREALCSIIEQYMHSACTYRTQNSDYNLDQVTQDMMLLTNILSLPCIAVLFSLRSLNDHIMMYSKLPTGNGHINLTKSQRITIGLSTLSRIFKMLISIFLNLDDERRLEESHGNHVYRALQSLVKWYTAITSLSTWLSRLGDQQPVFHMIFVRAPLANLLWTPECDMDPPSYEALRLLTLEYFYMDEEMDVLKAAVDDLFNTPNRVCPEDPVESSLHVEAITLGLMHSASTCDNISLAWPLHNSNRILGLAPPRQCCYCCNFVYGALSHPEKYRLQHESRNFDPEHLPKFSEAGLIVPWTPPPIEYGIPVDVLDFLELEMMGLLINILGAYLEPVAAHIPTLQQ